MKYKKKVSLQKVEQMHPIAHIKSDFPTKFGIPRQSGIVDTLQARVIFLPEYRNIDAIRGLESFSHIWLLWEFSEARREGWSPTVRPPRLGGNQRMGVFATRSPFRPNPIGLSAVKLLDIVIDHNLGPILVVGGADLMDGTPIYDIKPYLPYADCLPEATAGFAPQPSQRLLTVSFREELLNQVPHYLRQGLIDVLANDPRPQYQNDSDRVYGMRFSYLEIKFIVKDDTLTVVAVDIA